MITSLAIVLVVVLILLLGCLGICLMAAHHVRIDQ